MDEDCSKNFRETEEALSTLTAVPNYMMNDSQPSMEAEIPQPHMAVPTAERQDERPFPLAQIVSLAQDPETGAVTHQRRHCYVLQANLLTHLMDLLFGSTTNFVPRFILFDFDLGSKGSRKRSRVLKENVGFAHIKSKREALSRLFEALNVPPVRTRNTVKFFKGQPPIPSGRPITNRTPFCMSTVASTLAWSYCQKTGTTIAAISHEGPQADEATTVFVKALIEHSSLIGIPMLPAFLFHISATPGTQTWFGVHVEGIIEATELTGYHHNSALERRIDDRYDPATETAKVSGIAANLATNHNCWEAFYELALFILDELEQCSWRPAGADTRMWEEGLDYLRQHTKGLVTKTKSMVQETASWQQKASIQIQGLFNLIAQREQELGRKLAADSLRLTQASLELGEVTRQIAEESKRDSTSMKAIAAVTMCFLPGTFAASLFAMPVFRWNAASGSDVINQRIWVYWAVTIPLTLLTVSLYWLWDHIMNKPTNTNTENTARCQEVRQDPPATAQAVGGPSAKLEESKPEQTPQEREPWKYKKNGKLDIGWKK